MNSLEREAVDREELLRLSKLSPLKYDRERAAAAKNMGVGVKALDEEIQRIRRNAEVSEIPTDDVVETLEPWPEPVDGGRLADEIALTVERHVKLPSQAELTAVTLWALGTYCYDNFRLFPKLLIKSPQKRCGKSTLLEILEATTNSALLNSGTSPAALFRAVDLWHPTLLLDEIDRWPNDASELIAIVNSGHTRRSAFILRTVGDDHVPKKFSTWCPMALAGIGNPKDTIVDRSITIELQRRAPGESLEELPQELYEALRDVRRKGIRWAQDAMSALKASQPERLALSNDRAAANCGTLLSIAEAIGWGDRARSDLMTLHSERDTEENDASIMLLTDIQSILQGRDRIASETLVEKLINMEDRPWGEWRRGKPITQSGVARMLKGYRQPNGLAVKPKVIRFGDKTCRGYEAEQFKEVFRRYLPASAPNPPMQTVTPKQSTKNTGFSDFRPKHEGVTVTGQIPAEASRNAGCYGVTPQNGVAGAMRADEGPYAEEWDEVD